MFQNKNFRPKESGMRYAFRYAVRYMVRYALGEIKNFQEFEKADYRILKETSNHPSLEHNKT